MGIPAFYRWLVEKYPRSVAKVVEETPVTVNGVCIPLDTSKPNPNGVEFDNLYLDMNGIIHPCFHPQGLPAPMTYDDVFKGVFKYIDRIFAMIRPRKLLYMAIDGVAPRAKMNQQRGRRFKAAKEVEEASKRESLTGLDGTGVEEGKVTKLDSNVITPGTEFMEKLSSALRYYIHLKMNSDPGWRGIKVILSDASVPGEGEHKIMSYIRLQRRMPESDPNTRHCLYGLDADLIMLALATHEVHFSVLREDICKEPKKSKGSKERDYSSDLNMLHKGVKSIQGEDYTVYLEDYISRQRFQFLNIWVLREYLGLELRTPNAPPLVDLERFIDDFVFMCLFVGNDFLPHVPSLEMSEGAIDLLMMVYKTGFKCRGGYLTKSSEVYLARVEHFVQAIGAFENEIFKKRYEVRKQWEKHFQQRSATSSSKEVYKSMGHVFSDGPVSVDKVKLGEDGWKERYYCENFEVQGRDKCEGIKGNTVLKYVEGICWVMRYYYQGVCSWNWFYPYHYAPFASDFQGLGKLQIDFLLGQPLKPLEQLMAVLPASSAQAVPSSYRKLMTDPSSPILDFYPSNFELDMNGKRHAWQAVCKLPFIEESRLLSETEKVEHTLTDDEKRRNSLGHDKLFLNTSHQLATKILKFWECNRKDPKIYLLEIKMKIESEFSGGMYGNIILSDKPICPVEIFSPIHGMELIKINKVVSTFYQLPKFYPHVPSLCKGVILPEKSVSEHEVEPSPILWHEKTGFLRSRISQRRIPPRAISGSCLAKLSHQLVSHNYADEYMKNNSGVKRSEQNCLMVQKVGYVARASENNSKVKKNEQTCSVEIKDNNVDGSGENKSHIRKRKCVPDKIEEKKKKKKENRNNVDRRTVSNSEDRTSEQNCQVDQNDYDIDGEGEKNAEVWQRGEIIIVKEKDRNVDGSVKNKSQMPETIGKKRKKKNGNNEDNGTENNSEDRTREQNYQVDSMDGESVNRSAGREEKQNFAVQQKDNNADARTKKNSRFRKREQNCLWKQKGRNLNGCGKNKCQIRKGDIPNEIEKRKEKNGHSSDIGEQRCHVDQEDCNLVGEEGKSNSDIGERQHNLNIENKSQVWGSKCDTQNVRITKKNKDDTNEGIENNFEVKRRELNCQQKDTNADEESEIIPVVRNGEQNDSTVDGSCERNPEVRIRERDPVDDRIASKKKTLNGVDISVGMTIEELNDDMKGNSENKLVEMPDDKIAKKKNKKRKLKIAQKP